MAAFIACCRDVLAVMGWLTAGALATEAAQTPTPQGGLPARVIWSVAGEGRGTPAVYQDAAFFLSKHHQLVAIDHQSGRVRWRRSTGGPGPTTAGTAVLVTSTRVIAGDGGVIGFTHTGREVWRFDAGGVHPGTYLGGIADGTVFAGSSAGRIWALDAESGGMRWSADVAADGRAIVFAPVVDGGQVFAAYAATDALRDGGILAADAATGRVVWRRALPRTAAMRRGVAGGPLPAAEIVLCVRDDGTIFALARTTGALRWSLPSRPAKGGGWYEFRPLALAGTVLIAGSVTGWVTAYDLATRQERWRRHPMSASIVFGMATDGQTVYVPYLSGRLIALSVEDGAERWRTSSDRDGFSWKPSIAAGRVLAASSAAGFFAFGL